MASRRRSAGKCVLCGSVGTCLKEGCEHMHTGIVNFDVFTSTRWILQPEDKHGEVKHHLDIVSVVQDMREFLLTKDLYLAALEDLHAGLMADLAGQWYCDYYENRRYRKKPDPRNREGRVMYWFLHFLTRNFRPFSVQ